MPIMKAWTYITTNTANKVLYTGVTSDLKSRIESHKSKKYPNAFTARYNADKLVWFQEFDSILDARERERQLKAGNRARKIKLIEKMNQRWEDLYNTL
jgi:putative endonuclease